MKKWLLWSAWFLSMPVMASTIVLEGHDNIPEVWEFGSSSITFPSRTFQYTTTISQKNQVSIIYLHKDETHPDEQVVTFAYDTKKRIKMTVGTKVVYLNTQSSDIVKVDGPEPPGYTYYVKVLNDKAYAEWLKKEKSNATNP